MQKITSCNSGIYLLEIYIPKNFTLNIKKFSKINCQAGWYYYVGSAQKALNSRLERHKRKSKKIHWHIDHITAVQGNEIKNILVFLNRDKDFECSLNNLIHDKLTADYPLKGFGNSDCLSCVSHLSHSPKSLFKKIEKLFSKTEFAIVSGT